MKEQIIKFLDKYIIPVIIGILAISASIFISRALYNEEGKEIVSSVKTNFSLVKQFNYEEKGQEKSLIEFNLKEKPSYTEDYYSPVKENSTYLKIPEINGIIPDTIDVISISSKATNGKDEQREAKYEYDKESKILHIYDSNEANEKGEVYSGSTADYDEYEIIFYYNQKIELTEENSKITMPVLIRYESQNEEIGRIQDLTNNEITLEESGNIVSTKINTQDIYNGYIKSNISNGTNYSTEFSENNRVIVSNLIDDEITLQETNEFKTEDNEYKETNDITYKQIKINKQDLTRVLGNEGTLQVLDSNENIVLDINKDYKTDDTEITLDFENEVTGLNFKISKPANKGIIRIQETKVISPNMKDLNNKYVVTKHQLTSGDIENKLVNETEIKDAVTKVNTSIDKTEWTSNIQNDVKITATLVTSKSDCNLFKNPELQIELPSAVEKVVIGDSYLLNANGLSLKDVNVVENQDGKKVIVAKIEGAQTEYLFDNMIDGTNVVIPATIILNKDFASYSDNINIKYTNEIGKNNETGVNQIAVNLQAITEIKKEDKTEEANNNQNSAEQENNGQDNNNQQNNGNASQETVVENNNEPARVLSKVETLKQNNGLSVTATAQVGQEIVSKETGNDSEKIDDQSVFERQVIKYEVTVKNNTNETINNIAITGEVPNYTKYATVESGKHWDEKLKKYVYNIQDDLVYNYITDETVKNYQFKNISTLEPGETKSEYYEVVVGDLENEIESADISNNISVNVDSENYGTYTLKNKILQAKIDVKLKAQTSGTDKFAYKIDLTNLTDSDLNNVHIETTEIPEELKYDTSFVIYSENETDNGKIEDNKFKIDISSIKANSLQSIMIRFSGANYEENKNQIELKMAATATVDGTGYISNENKIYAYPQYVKATMALDQEGQNVKPDDELTYKITVKNESKVRTNVTISDNLPKGLTGVEATYLSYNIKEETVQEGEFKNDIQNYDIEEEANLQYDLVENKLDLSVKTDSQDDISITTVIPAGKTITIMAKVKVDEVDQNTEISNFATISGVTINTVTSNIVKVTALTNVDWDYIDGKKDDIDDGNNDNDNNDNNNNNNQGDNSDDNNSGNNNGGDNNNNSGDNNDNGDNNNNDNNSNATYSISGITWLDENGDGRRIENEKRLNGITVKLFDAETNSIVTIDNKKMIVQANNNGEYKFENIPAGRYYCLFEYDTSKYEITKYQVKGVDEGLNNDANKSQVTIDGVAKEVGITDILQVNKNLENIDLGLIENKVFDLKLEKNISKVTVSNSKGDKEYSYKNTSLAKVEIPKKQLEGSIVKIEYNIIVTNEGTLEGYANEVTDYLPDGLTLDDSNSNGWTVNKDGSLKNTSLASKTLAPGESKTLKLYLTKTVTSNSVGITKNSAEITKSSNAKNLKDVDSTAGNKVQGEDDYDSADILISVSTGLYRNTLIIILIGGGVYLLIRVIRKYNKKFPTIMMMIMATVLIGTTVSNAGWYETINWVGANGQLSNGWHCTWKGAHQCAVANHTYWCTSTGSYVTSSSTSVLKTITLTKESTSKKFTYLNSSYNIVGPYKVKCNYSIKGSSITATVAGTGSASICDASGNAISWTSGKNKTFYVKVPKTVTAVTRVTVNVTVGKATKVTKNWRNDYSASCVSISGQHQNGSNQNISTSAGACQTAGKHTTSTTTSEEDGSKSVSWGPVYAGSLIIRKYDNEKKKSNGSDYELSSTCGARFTVKDSAGHTVATNVTPKQTIRGLPPGTYTVTETRAPNNYNLSLQSLLSRTTTTKSAVVKGGVGAGHEPTTVTFKFYNQKYVDLELSKVDTDDSTGIEGIGFTIYDNAHKKYIKSDGSQTSTATTIYTNSNGKISIKNIRMYDTSQTFTVKEVESKNLYYKSDKTITKTISCKKGSSTYEAKATIKNKKAYSLTVEKKDPDKTDQNLTAYFYIQYQDGTWLTKDSKYQNSPSSITVTKSLKLSGIKRGKYHVWEYKTPKGYDITQQDNYGSDSSHPTWVDCGSYNVGVNSAGKEDNNVASVKLTRNNKKWIRHVTGFVWQENPSGKRNGFDNVFGSGDQKLSGIKVEFIKKNGTVLQSTTTGSDGSYSFTFFKKVLYWDLRDYMVRFTFDNGTYSTVRADLAVESRNASRALESHEWGNDSYATGSGIATTIPDASTLEESIAKYYNDDNYTIETLNLGLMKKVNQEYSIIENLDKVILQKGNYKFTYEYGKKAIVQNIPQNPGIYDRVAIQNSSASFTQKLYPSDIAYNNTVSENKFEVYVDYNITITNTMTINIEDVYMEKSLNITSLTNTFNSELYEISDGNWQGNGGGNVKYKNSISPIGPGGNVTIPIRFKVKETGLQQIIQGSKYNPNIYKDCATVAIANGYHIYERYDYSWGYKPSPYRVKHEHRTANQELSSGTITLRLTLAEQRTISGNVFEDTQTAESARDHTRVGNGLYDNSERKVKAVKVALLNKNDESVSKLYSTEGNYLRQEGNIWKFTPQEGEVDVKNDGTYELKGVVTGEYYLRFTYSNGTQVIVNGGANNISIMDYKSTILTGAATNYSQENWYLDVMGGTNSIATDKYYIDENGRKSDTEIIKMRTESQKEINYSSKVKFNQGQIQALSEAIDVNFEYLKERNKDYDYPFKPNCTGMNFGIIERPHLDIQLEKSIKNVKLTLSNGTNLINGNPEIKTVSEFLTGVTKSYAKIETDYTNLFGSTVTVTYKLTAKNKSEIDYASSEYYRFGRKGSSEPVGTAVTKIVDYLSYKQCNYVDTTAAEDKIDVTNNEYTNNDGYSKENYYVDGVMEENQKNYKDQVLKASTQYIIPEAVRGGNSEADYTVTVNKLLPSTNTTNDLGWLSYSEIIGITNPTYTTQYVSAMGSYKAGDSQKVAQGGTSENDNSDSTITITPPTGKNKSYTIFIVIAGSLAVIAGGVVVIKKFVL